MELCLPLNCVALDRNEMMYLDGGWLSISKGVFKQGCNIAAMAALTALSGGVAIGGLRTVLASYSLKVRLVSSVVKAAGILGINVGNALSSKIVSGIAGAALGDVFGWVFDKYIDRLDGVANGYVKIF